MQKLRRIMSQSIKLADSWCRLSNKSKGVMSFRQTFQLKIPFYTLPNHARFFCTGWGKACDWWYIHHLFGLKSQSWFVLMRLSAVFAGHHVISGSSPGTASLSGKSVIRPCLFYSLINISPFYNINLCGLFMTWLCTFLNHPSFSQEC